MRDTCAVSTLAAAAALLCVRVFGGLCGGCAGSRPRLLFVCLPARLWLEHVLPCTLPYSRPKQGRRSPADLLRQGRPSSTLCRPQELPLLHCGKSRQHAPTAKFADRAAATGP